MRTQITRSFSFAAAHQLPWHPGKCQRPHGHNYRLEVTVEGPVGEHGVVMDFDDLKAVVQAQILDRFDHRDLNELFPNPTAEVVAADIWKSLEAAGLALAGVRLWETDSCSVELRA